MRGHLPEHDTSIARCRQGLQGKGGRHHKADDLAVVRSLLTNRSVHIDLFAQSFLLDRRGHINARARLVVTGDIIKKSAKGLATCVFKVGLDNDMWLLGPHLKALLPKHSAGVSDDGAKHRRLSSRMVDTIDTWRTLDSDFHAIRLKAWGSVVLSDRFTIVYGAPTPYVPAAPTQNSARIIVKDRIFDPPRTLMAHYPACISTLQPSYWSVIA